MATKKKTVKRTTKKVVKKTTRKPARSAVKKVARSVKKHPVVIAEIVAVTAAIGTAVAMFLKGKK